MTNPSHLTRTDLLGVTTKSRNARAIVAVFLSELPALAESLRHIDACLTDIPTLAAHIDHLNAALAQARGDRADLVAAACATLTAHNEGEPDPLWYLRDELTHQAPETWGRA